MQCKTAYTLLALAALVIAATGCSPLHRIPVAHRNDTAVSTSSDLSSVEHIKEMLYKQLNEWQNVPYRNGGLSKNGVDCSGFVYLTYLSKFGIRIPRTTKHQVAAGRTVGLDNLKAGDLVFFRTGIKSRHVGIYIENQSFIHASKSSGVMLSRLDDVYWSKKYWKAVRIHAVPYGKD